jgi:uncharacterized membrane protein
MSVTVPIDRWQRGILAAVIVASLLILSLSQYLIWTELGAGVIEGLQGRYFLPIAPLALLLVASNRLRWSRWPVAIVAVVGNGMALIALARHYYTW